MIPDLILVTLVGVLVAASIQDIASMRISNIFPITVILMFGLWIAVQGFPGNGWENGVHFLIALIVGMGLFAMGWIGGGDAKLYASCALWFGLAAGPILLFSVTMMGLILLVIMLATRKIRRKQTQHVSFDAEGRKRSMQLPYGVAIAAGTIFAIYWVGVNPGTMNGFDPTAVTILTD